MLRTEIAKIRNAAASDKLRYRRAASHWGQKQMLSGRNFLPLVATDGLVSVKRQTIFSLSPRTQHGYRKSFEPHNS